MNEREALKTVSVQVGWYNATTGGFPMTVTYPGAGANVTVAPDTTARLQGDGVDLFGVAGAINGDLLRFDGSLWMPPASCILSRVPPPFEGALLGRTADQSIADQTATDVIWQAADYGTDGFWPGAPSAEAIIPSGVTKLRLTASVRWENISTGDRECWFSKNGSAFAGRTASFGRL